MAQRSSYRPSEYTRHSLLRAGTDLFAERGFQDTTVRAIVAKARVNQAAINYHFDGKEGLYREVLRAAADAFTRAEPATEQENGLSPEENLRRFVQLQLRPLLARDEIGRYLRIFAWESIRPSKVLRQFLASEAPPIMNRAVGVVQRFLPGISDRDALCAAIWLMGQCSVFVRNREHFNHPPFSLKIDEAFVAYLTDFITGLALRGLGHFRHAGQSRTGGNA
jgi:TetR/AcrR family transcriptional regulator, regulator of cefoperazone and chloramphenicol sensitivity